MAVLRLPVSGAARVRWRDMCGRPVVDADGRRLGRLEMVIDNPDRGGLAVVRRALRRRRLFVSLTGARIGARTIQVVAPPAFTIPTPLTARDQT